jgi:hypothetical protein
MADTLPPVEIKLPELRKASDDWPIRVLALVPLVGIALLWSNHHLGVGAGQPALVASLTAVVPLGLGLLTKLLDKDESASLEKGIRAWIARHLTWRLLIVAYLVLAIVVLTWTSVVVIAEDGGKLGRVVLHDLDDPGSSPKVISPEAKGDPARFVRPSHPLGRPVKLELEGFVPLVTEVYPITGLRVRPSIDLKRSPSVLLRFSRPAIGSWKDVGGVKLRIVVLDAKGDEELIATVKEPAGALLLGRGQTVPTAWSSNWQIELAAKGVTDPVLVARDLQTWKQPKVLPLTKQLEPGMHLRVTLTNDEKHVFAASDFFLGKDELQDQRVEDLE